MWLHKGTPLKTVNDQHGDSVKVTSKRKRVEMTEQKRLGLRAEPQAGVDELDNGLHKEARSMFS